MSSHSQWSGTEEKEQIEATYLNQQQPSSYAINHRPVNYTHLHPSMTNSTPTPTTTYRRQLHPSQSHGTATPSVSVTQTRHQPIGSPNYNETNESIIKPERTTLLERSNTCPLPATQPKAKIIRGERFFSLEDGSFFGHWTDGVSLLIHPQITTVTHFLPDGSVCRCVSACLTSATNIKFIELLAFRNMVTPHPVLDEHVWKGQTHTHASAFPFARWGIQPASALKTINQTNPIHFTPNSTSPNELSSNGDTMEGTSLSDSPTIICPARHLSDGSIQIEALEGGISLTLLPNRRWVRLTFPVPLKRTVNGVTSDGVMKYEYTYADFSQLYPVEAVPKEWKFPLRSALQAAASGPFVESQKSHHLDTQTNSDPDLPSSLFTTSQRMDSPIPLQHPLSPNQHQISEYTQNSISPHGTAETPSHFDLIMDLPVPRSIHPSSVSGPSKIHVSRAFIEPSGPMSHPHTPGQTDLSWPDNPGHSVTLLHSITDSLPKNSLVPIMWTRQALYWSFPETRRVIALIHADQSALILEANGFIYHYLEPIPSNDETNSPGQVREKIYAAGAVPLRHNASGLNPNERSYELNAIASLAVKLQSHAIGVLESRALDVVEAHRKLKLIQELQPGFEMTEQELAALSIQPDQLPANYHQPIFSTQIHEQSIVRGVGEFTAFKDGRVKVRFVDRCLLELNASRIEANLLLPNGFPLRLSIPSEEANQPIYRQYLQPTFDFAHWAYQTQEQRDEYQRQLRLREESNRLELERTKLYLTMSRLRGGTSRLPLRELRSNNNTFSQTLRESCTPSTNCTPMHTQQLHTFTQYTNYRGMPQPPESIKKESDRTQSQTPSTNYTDGPSILPSFSIHHAHDSLTTTDPSPSPPQAHSTHQPGSQSHLDSLLSPIAHHYPNHSTAPTPIGTSFLLTPNAPPPISHEYERFQHTPQIHDLSYWLKDIEQRNHQMKAQLDRQAQTAIHSIKQEMTRY